MLSIVLGLTSDLYSYVILSTFDACLWMRKVNFTGRLVYFDNQQRDCRLGYQPLSINISAASPSPSIARYDSSYYRSNLSFRPDHDQPKSSKPMLLSASNLSTLSITNRKTDTPITVNLCQTRLMPNDEYFSFADFNRRLTKSYQLHARSLYDGLNYVLRLVHSNLLDCRTYRLKSTKRKSPALNSPDVFIYTTKESTSTSFTKNVNLIGRYSSANDDYQSCQTNKRHDLLPIDKPSSARIYYITSVFDEPFLMLRKRTQFYSKFGQTQIDLKELRGHVFSFDELEGFCVDLAEKVCSILKITCRFRIVHDGAFGSQNATTGIWNG
jgi:hypothetical protein